MKRTSFLPVVIGAVTVAGFAAAAMGNTKHQVQAGPGGADTYDPPNVNVAPGDTIVWTFKSALHTVTSSSATNCAGNCPAACRFDSGKVAMGGTFMYTVPVGEPDGVINYYCTNHCVFGMVGTITVDANLKKPAVPALSWGWLIALPVLMAAVGAMYFRRLGTANQAA